MENRKIKGLKNKNDSGYTNIDEAKKVARTIPRFKSTLTSHSDCAIKTPNINGIATAALQAFMSMKYCPQNPARKQTMRKIVMIDLVTAVFGLK
jgi:hypothetical protein